MVDDFQALQRKVEKLKGKRDEAKGARDQLLRRLRKEFGCKTLKEAKILLEKKKEEEVEAAVKYTKAKNAFERKWKRVLEDLD